MSLFFVCDHIFHVCIRKYKRHWYNIFSSVQIREKERERKSVHKVHKKAKGVAFNYSCSYKRSFVKSCRKNDSQWLLTKREDYNK